MPPPPSLKHCCECYRLKNMVTGHHLRKLSEEFWIFDISMTSQGARHLRTKHEMTKIVISASHQGAKEGDFMKNWDFSKMSNLR